jgi:hypothetical protein
VKKLQINGLTINPSYIELKNNAVWILQGNDCFAALSTKEFSEEEKQQN